MDIFKYKCLINLFKEDLKSFLNNIFYSQTVYKVAIY
jgi:hypothetical protein